MNTHPRKCAAALLLTTVCALPSAFAENVRIAFIDPLSGPFASLGQNILKSFQMVVEQANAQKWAGSNTIEVVGFDDKGSPEALASGYTASFGYSLGVSLLALAVAAVGLHKIGIVGEGRS